MPETRAINPISTPTPLRQSLRGKDNRSGIPMSRTRAIYIHIYIYVFTRYNRGSPLSFWNIHLSLVDRPCLIPPSTSCDHPCCSFTDFDAEIGLWIFMGRAAYPLSHFLLSLSLLFYGVNRVISRVCHSEIGNSACDVFAKCVRANWIESFVRNVCCKCIGAKGRNKVIK